MTKLRHDDPPRDLTISAKSNRYGSKPYKHVSDAEKARQSKALREERRQNGEVILEAERKARKAELEAKYGKVELPPFFANLSKSDE